MRTRNTSSSSSKAAADETRKGRSSSNKSTKSNAGIVAKKGKKRNVRPGICANCKCDETETDLWRNDILAPEQLRGIQMVCNACGLWAKDHGSYRPPELWKHLKARAVKAAALAAERGESLPEEATSKAGVLMTPESLSSRTTLDASDAEQDAARTLVAWSRAAHALIGASSSSHSCHHSLPLSPPALPPCWLFEQGHQRIYTPSWVMEDRRLRASKTVAPRGSFAPLLSPIPHVVLRRDFHSIENVMDPYSPYPFSVDDAVSLISARRSSTASDRIITPPPQITSYRDQSRKRSQVTFAGDDE